jgi:glycosyltransferase involved in cell wall biosynthesis
MHVLVISTGYPTDYVPLDGIFYRDQAEALAADGHTVGFIAINPVSVKSVLTHKKFTFGLSTFTEKGVNTYLYKYLNIPKYPTYVVRQAERKGRLLADRYIDSHGKPDIVHLHCYEAVPAAIYIKKKFGVPFIVTEHSSRFLMNTVPSSMEKYAAMAFSESGYNISVSEEFAKVLHKKYQQEFHFLPNIADTEFYKPSASKNIKSEFTFLSAGILNDNKNHRLLIDAFSKFIHSGKKAKLVIAGDGPERESLTTLVTSLGLGKQISFNGWISRAGLAVLMNKSDVFVLCSKKETFGVVLIEAMACGNPVISTRSGGPQSIIKDARTGILCDHDVQSLFLAMQEVYDNFAAYDSRVIRQVVLDNFSPGAIAKKLTGIYTNVLNRK